MSLHDNNDYYAVVPDDSDIVTAKLAAPFSHQWRLYSARAEAVFAHVVRPLALVLSLRVHGW